MKKKKSAPKPCEACRIRVMEIQSYLHQIETLKNERDSAQAAGRFLASALTAAHTTLDQFKEAAGAYIGGA